MKTTKLTNKTIYRSELGRFATKEDRALKELRVRVGTIGVGLVSVTLLVLALI